MRVTCAILTERGKLTCSYVVCAIPTEGGKLTCSHMVCAILIEGKADCIYVVCAIPTWNYCHVVCADSQEPVTVICHNNGIKMGDIFYYWYIISSSNQIHILS
jgi:hypothetical protein